MTIIACFRASYSSRGVSRISDISRKLHHYNAFAASIAIPLPCKEEEEESPASTYTPYTTKFNSSTTTTAAAANNNSNSSSTASNTTNNNKTKGGSGGGGRIKCPKCGQHVLFQHADFEENTFYCATCSSWFLVTSSSSVDSTTNFSEADFRRQQQQLSMSYNPAQIKDFLAERDRYYSNPSTTSKVPPKSNVSAKPEGEQTATSESYKAYYSTDSKTTRIPTPVEICNGLDEYVIGQKNVKMALSVSVYNHYKRVALSERNYYKQQQQQQQQDINTITAEDEDSSNKNQQHKTYCEVSGDMIRSKSATKDDEICEIDKSNLIIIGPTGSGKTLLVKTLAKLIDVPLVIADATCLTQAGYVGEDVESILLKLYHEAGQDLEKCQKGIVYIDEADKIRKSGGNISISRDVSGEGVQHALLKIVEGNVINVPKEPGRKNPRGDFLAIDTTNILFICGGAFSGLEKIINRRLDGASIGFGAKMKKNLEDHDVQGNYFDKATPKDLVEYGMIPEFIGRFPVIESTKGLSEENLVEILTTPKNALMKQYKVLFSEDNSGINFYCTPCALKEIAKIAFTRGTGARGLRSITENILMETMYVVPSLPDVHTVYLDASAVRRERKPVLLKHPDITVEKYEEMKKQGLVYNEEAYRSDDQDNEAAVA